MAMQYTLFMRLTLLVVAAAGIAALAPSEARAQQPGLVMGAIPSSGIGLVAFEGSVDGLRASAQSQGCQLESVWATVGGRFVGYTFGRPAFVNAGFASDVGTTLRSDQVLLVVCGAGAAPPTSPPTVAPPPGATPPPPSATPPPSGGSAPPFSTTPLYDPDGPILSCSDFPTQADAQILFEAAGGPGQDRHGLDPDGNGLACEELP